ncbi:hypothetical protein [Streptosporangium vulgare]|uniref:PASTA domain-containing protein n=1 Tax=Streptosporangium vulgare TaxID=46190 RepID=A0ABV5TSN0_9ACTN
MTATDNHPFWIEKLRAWIPARQLQSGMRLQTSTGTYVQVSATIQLITLRQRLHNISAESPHTYHVAVGDADALVHNASPDPAVSRLPDLTGMTQPQADAVLSRYGFELHSISEIGAYATHKSPDGHGSKVSVRLADGHKSRSTVIDNGPNDKNGNRTLSHNTGENFKC